MPPFSSSGWGLLTPITGTCAIINHAHGQRFAGKQPQDDKNFIEVNEQWQKELQASPFYSRKASAWLMI